MGDEEILARVLKGFFGGWIFAPEKGLITVLGWAGRKLVSVGFEGEFPIFLLILFYWEMENDGFWGIRLNFFLIKVSILKDE